MNILLVTPFTARCMQDLFLMEQEAVPWHSSILKILACPWRSATATNFLLNAVLDNDAARQTVCNEFKTNADMIARQVNAHPHTVAQVLETIAASEILSIQTHFQRLFRHMTLAARKIMDVSPCLSFFISANSFSVRPSHLPKHMSVAHTKLRHPNINRHLQNALNPAAIVTPGKYKLKHHWQKQVSSTTMTLPGLLDTTVPLTRPRKCSDTPMCNMRTQKALRMTGVKKSLKLINTDQAKHNSSTRFRSSNARGTTAQASTQLSIDSSYSNRLNDRYSVHLIAQVQRLANLGKPKKTKCWTKVLSNPHRRTELCS